MRRLIEDTCEGAREYAVVAWCSDVQRRAEHLDELARRADFVIDAIEAEALLWP